MMVTKDVRRSTTGVTVGRPPGGKRRPVVLAVWLLVLLGLVLGLAGTALASAGSYSLKWTAADPAVNKAPYLPTYDKKLPSEVTWPLSGRQADPMQNAVMYGPTFTSSNLDAVTSLMPKNLGLGQIVPYELEIKVSGVTTPENGTITITPYWLCKVTNGDDFGFDPAYKVIAAFVDTADVGTVDPGQNATVSGFTSDVFNENTSNEQIQGTITVTGLDNGDNVVVEIWVVLKSTIGPSIGGNVQTGLVSAATVSNESAKDRDLKPGNQTVSLLQVGDFYSATADVSIVKSDHPSTLFADYDDPNLPGGILTYDIVVTNNSTDTVANGVTVTDLLDSLTTYVSSDPAYTSSAAGPTGFGQQITWYVGTLEPLESRTITLVVRVSPSFGTGDDYDKSVLPEEPGGPSQIIKGSAGPYDLVNKVAVSAMTTDPTPGNNEWYEPTNVIPTSTAVVVTSFDAQLDRNRVVVTWQTGSEMNTAGFYVERWDEAAQTWVTVNKNMVPALFESQAGGTYAVVDKGAKANEPLLYQLIEVETSGKRLPYGPYEVTARKALPSGEAAKQLGKGAEAARVPRVTKLSAAPAPAVSTRAVTFASASPDRLRIEVTASGLYRIDAADLVAGLGMADKDARALIKAKGVKLTNQGASVAFLPAADGSALYFYGQSIDTIYTGTNVYWLTKGTGLAVASLRSVANKAAVATTFIDTVKAEENKLQAPGVIHDPEGDFWLWTYAVAGSTTIGTMSITVEAPEAVTPAPAARLNVALQGMVSADHHAKISVNGAYLGETTWSGLTAKEVGFSIPAGVLKAGANTVQITPVLDAGVKYSYIALDYVDLTYTRATKATAGQLEMTAAAATPVKVNGLAATGAWVLDLSTPQTPKLISQSASGTTKDGAWLTFVATAGRDYLVAHALSALRPQAITATAAPLQSGGADYVIITTPALRAAADTLAAYRSEQGYATLVTTIGEIYDGFANGIATPHAIRNFIAYARTNWNPAPRYVVLAGEGSYDYRNYAGFNDCLVPTLLTDTAGGLAPSDVMLADVVGDDGVPEVAIGRIPALTAAELEAQIAKIQAYEATPVQASVLFAADNADRGGDFAADSDYLADIAASGGLQVEKAYLEKNKSNLATVKQQLLAALQSGNLLVNYVGHGGALILTDEVILNSDMVAALPSGSRPGVVTAFTCTVGRYSFPGADALAEVLVKKAGAGAVAMWAPTALQMNTDSVRLGVAFTEELVAAQGNAVLGDIIRTAMAEHSSLTEALRTYNLLGDPALHMSW